MKEEIRYSNPTALTNSQDYRCLITSLKQRYLSARLKAAQSVSRELLQFYSMYSQVITILPQVAEEFKASNLPQLVADLKTYPT